jgi:hypothetical protein
MGCVKETYDFIKDSLKGVSNRRKFKKLIDNMIFAIETKTVSEYFIYKFKILEKLASSINITKEKDYLEKYRKIKLYYNNNFKNLDETS